jgi:hypothetical protein
MASLKKRGKYYYGRWQKVTENGRKDICRTLGIKNKAKAEEALEILDKLEEAGEVDPYSANFNPKQILNEEDKFKNRYIVHRYLEIIPKEK